MRKLRRVRTAAMAVVIAGCAAQSSVPPTPLDQEVRVMVGGEGVDPGDADLLREVVPPPTNEDATLSVVFDMAGSELASEEAAPFLTAGDDGGTVVLDVLLRPGTVHRLPEGTYTITAYYRRCVGDCSLLGAARDICAMHQPVFADGEYRFRVGVADRICELESLPPLAPIP